MLEVEFDLCRPDHVKTPFYVFLLWTDVTYQDHCLGLGIRARLGEDSLAKLALTSGMWQHNAPQNALHMQNIHLGSQTAWSLCENVPASWSKKGSTG